MYHLVNLQKSKSKFKLFEKKKSVELDFVTDRSRQFRFLWLKIIEMDECHSQIKNLNWLIYR